MPTYQTSGLDLHYVLRGADPAPNATTLIFQHGIGGDVRQPSRFLTPQRTSLFLERLNILHADFRGHGRSPLGPEEDLSLATLAADMVGLLDHLGIERAIVGGISMGAAVALRVAVEYPQRCSALILSRPAWTDGAMSAKARAAYQLVARLLSAGDWQSSATATLERSDILQEMEAVCPDAAKSIRSQLQSVVNDPRSRESAVIRLRRLPCCRGLEGGLETLAAVQCPTLILAAAGNPIHPLGFARLLADHLPNCRLVQIAPKSPLDDTQHRLEVDRLIGLFLEAVAFKPSLFLAGVAGAPQGSRTPKCG